MFRERDLNSLLDLNPEALIMTALVLYPQMIELLLKKNA